MINNIPSDKYNIAWFKIADCVARGEKERALGMYRLLAHSFDDRAFSSQLEGDILHSFGDIQAAKSRYDQAIDLYKNENRLLEAAAVCENMHCAYPIEQSYLLLLADLYHQLHMVAQLALCLDKLVAVYLTHGHIQQVEQLLKQYEKALTPETMLSVSQRFIYAIIRRSDLDRDRVLYHIQKVIDRVMIIDRGMALQQFLDLLLGIDESYYQEISEYITTKSD